MKYGYARTSTKEQHEDRQMVSFDNNDILPENIFLDKQTGTNFGRPAYKKLLSILKEGDVMYIHAIDRLGRNYDEILKQWTHITKEIKADIVVLDMPLLDTRARSNDLTGKFIADITLQILSYVAQKETDLRKQRQLEGIAIAKAKGRFRKKDIDFDMFHDLEKKIKAGELTVTEACEKMGFQSRNTWYNLRNEVAQKSEVCVS